MDLIKNTVSAIILAGGQSRRMGKDKSLLDINGMPMIQHIHNQLKGKFHEIIIGANDIGKYDFLKLKVVPDQKAECGPLMGISSCIAMTANDINFVTACDMPHLNIELMNEILSFANDYDIVMPVSEGNKYEPLFASYQKSILPISKKILDSGQRRVIDLIDHVNVKFIKIKKINAIANINTPKEYHDII